MNTYLITGGTGLIGSALCQQLLARNENIIIFSRQPKNKVHQSLSKDITVVNSLSEIGENTNIDIVVNLAGEPIAQKRWSLSRKQQLENSRIELTNILVKWLASRTIKPHKLISGSAIGWYGDMRAEIVTEQSEYHDEYTHQLCNSWEHAALQAEKSGITVCIIRTGLVLSTNGGVLKQMLLPFQLGLGGKIATGEHYMSWIHIEDEVNLILHLANNDKASGIYNATAPEPVTNKQFSKILAKTISRPCFLTTPAWLLKTMLGELSRLLIYGQRVFPKKAQAEGFKFNYTKLEDALNHLLKK